MSNLAPAAQIVAGLSSESLAGRMQRALDGVEALTFRNRRFDAYRRAGIDVDGIDTKLVTSSDSAALGAELNRRSGIDI